MKVYDYHENNLLSTILFVLITIVCLTVLAFLVINSIKAIKKRGFCKDTILLLGAVTVVLILTCFLSYQTFTLVKFDVICASGDYEFVSGSLEIVSITQNDYRDVEQYDIEFIVDGTHFKNTNSFSAEQKELISSNLEKDVEVRFSFIGKELVIYQIIICEDE